jgi:hypothetical protein
MNDDSPSWIQQAAVFAALGLSSLGFFLAGLAHAYDVWKKWSKK